MLNVGQTFIFGLVCILRLIIISIGEDSLNLATRDRCQENAKEAFSNLEGPTFFFFYPLQAPSPTQDQEKLSSIYILLLQLIIELISGSNLIRHDI